VRIALPKTYVEGPITGDPVFFLAGPIQGGNEWQVMACNKLLQEGIPEGSIVAVPCRWGENHILRKYFLNDIVLHSVSQTVWERRALYLAGRASSRGCIIAWLPEESKEHPRTGGNPYAQDTRGEIGEWRGQMMYDEHIRFSIGGEPGFPGLDVIKKNFDDALQVDFPIFPTLDETIENAINIALYHEPSIPSRSS